MNVNKKETTYRLIRGISKLPCYHIWGEWCQLDNYRYRVCRLCGEAHTETKVNQETK